MPDIDPAALGRSEPNVVGSSTPSITVKALPGAASSAQKTGKPAPSAPRLDIEPLYAALKTAVGEHWNTYKAAISRFVLGCLSQEELSRLTDHFIAVDAHREHLHNQLLCGLYANILRDVPELAVAGWVSANDKPLVVSKPVTGDAAEQRLKVEVMQLPPRIRHRLKGIQDEQSNPVTHSLVIHAQSKRIHNTTSLPSLPTSSTASASTGLNRDLEVRKRYALPLATENHDLPPLSSLTDRLVPICYEEGLPSGPASPGPCVDLLSTGLETFVKELVTSILSRSRTDAPVSGPDYATASSSSSSTGLAVSVTNAVGVGSAGSAMGVVTAGYKRRLESEDAAFRRGDLKRSETGLLPCEVAASCGLGLQGDLRIAWNMGEPWLTGLMPWLGEKVVLGDYPYSAFEHDGAEEDMMRAMDVNGRGHRDDFDARGLVGGTATKTNGVHVVVNGDGVDHNEDAMQLDEPDWCWQGAGARERAALGSLLDDCLAIGQ